MANNFFPPRPKINPSIYAYEDTNPQYAGLLKIGFTTKSVQDRVAQQYPTLKPGKLPYRIVLQECAMRSDGTAFTDRDVHRYLCGRGIPNPEGEWFQCTVEDVRAAILAIRRGELNEEQRTLDFCMRPEQRQAVERTVTNDATTWPPRLTVTVIRLTPASVAITCVNRFAFTHLTVTLRSQSARSGIGVPSFSWGGEAVQLW